MPRPRFAKLTREKQERILQAAAQQFAAHGYENASLNQILSEAGISKGAAYYYFDDKADLFATAIRHYTTLLAGEAAHQPEVVTAETFWPQLRIRYQEQFQLAQDKPWAFGLVKSAGRVGPELLTRPELADLIREVQGWLGQIIQQGQALGVIRTDLPEGLLINLFMAVDDGLDQWLLQHWDALDAAAITELSGKVLTGLQQFLAPVE